MLKIECNDKGVKDNESHVEVDFLLEAHCKKQVVNEVAAVISAMYQKIPRELFLDGVCESDFGKNALKEMEDF